MGNIKKTLFMGGIGIGLAIALFFISYFLIALGNGNLTLNLFFALYSVIALIVICGVLNYKKAFEVF